MKAYVTFLTDDYLPGVVALANSIKIHSEYPLYAMHHGLNERSINKLKTLNVIPIKINRIKSKNESKKYTNTYSKLAAFGLTQFNQLIFMDADTIMLKSLDPLFDIKEPFAAAPDHGIQLRDHIFNSGVMVIQPSKKLMQSIINNIDRLSSYDGGDQGFLNSFFTNNWKKIDQKYNVLKRIYVHHPKLWKQLDVHAIHFVHVKPWNDSDDSAYKQLNNIWKKYYDMKRFNQYFPNAFCINLDKREDKWAASVEQFAKFDMEVNRFKAVEGNPIGAKTRLSDGEVGCILSHVEILKHAKKNKWPHVMIFEDDVEFQDNFIVNLHAAMGDLPNDWDMFYLGGDHSHAKFFRPVINNIYRSGAVLHTHSYAARDAVYDMLIKGLMDFSFPADQRFKRIHPGIKTYAVYPNLTWQRNGWSDVQERMTEYDWINPNVNTNINNTKGEFGQFNDKIKKLMKK